MKRSEIKDLYNQSDAALRELKYKTLILPYSSDQVIAENILKAAAQAAELWKPVKLMCDYMIDDGSTDMTERLLNIKSEVSTIEHSVVKMWKDHKDDKDELTDEFMELSKNCRAIINTIKDMEECTANGVEPQHKHIEAPQQPIGGNSGELAGNDNENAPEGSDNGSKYIELPLSMQTDDKRAEKVFTEAFNKEWLQVIDNQHGKWIGFAKTKDGNIKNYEQSLAWLIVEIYDPERKGIDNWLKFEKYFNISNLSKHWGNALTYYNRTGRKRDWQIVIDKLIKAALQ